MPAIKTVQFHRQGLPPLMSVVERVLRRAFRKRALSIGEQGQRKRDSRFIAHNRLSDESFEGNR